MNIVKKDIIIFFIFGAIYYSLEVLCRGYSYLSMFILGGICGVLIGYINEFTPDMPMLKQCFLGSLIITTLEFITGYFLNIKLGLNIWDYSNMPFNIMGQICPQFTFIWCILSYPTIKLDDFLRDYLLK